MIPNPRIALISAGNIAHESDKAPAELRKRVASPGGTIAALKVPEDARLRDIFMRALTAARDRGVEMARKFGRDGA